MGPKEMTTEPSSPQQASLAHTTQAATCSPLRKKPASAVRSSPSKTTTSATTTTGKKRVRWATITIHEFGVGLGGSSVPTKGGPAIGLADAPEFTWTTKVGHMAERSEGVRRFTPEERVRLLQRAGETDGMILRFSRETNIILASRRRSLAEDDDVEAQRAQAKKRKAEMLDERPCAAFLSQRPRMIPASYV